MPLSDRAQDLALAIWQEQLDNGIGQPDEMATVEHLDEWVANRNYPASTLEQAAAGDIEALTQVRTEAGLPPFS